MTGVTHLTPSSERDPNRPRQDSAETRRRLAALIEAASQGDRAAFPGSTTSAPASFLASYWR